MKKITEHIGYVEYSSKIMAGVQFPTKTIFIELEKNEVLVISPGPFEEQDYKKWLGPYSKVYCATLNSTHHRHLQSFHKIFPNVSVYGPESIHKKQPWIRGILKGLGELESLIGEQWSFFKIEGNKFLDETVLYCANSKTLVTTDILFNMREPMPWGRRQILKMVGAYNKIDQSKLVKITTKDRESYHRSIQGLMNLDCKLIVISHGEMIAEPDVANAFRNLL